jgi:diguanylate cyclase (GGDEF)-like protein
MTASSKIGLPPGLPVINAASTEAERLAALRRLELLDTPDEPEFDELVATAAAICGTPMSLITLVDESRQWFKAVYGITQRETSREVSFCHHAIQQNDVMMVEDAHLDSRFSNNPEVTGGLRIRFYAGVTICEPGGQPVGTLCVLDHVARHLSEEKVAALRVLGQKANARLALREQRLTLQRALAATKEANVRLMAMATTDPLTGLSNRRAFLDRLMVVFAEARRHSRPLSVVMLDIDNFKCWNDRHGHDVGDEILVRFANVLKNAVRITDMVVRYGGEEFVVLLPETDEGDAMTLTRRILASIRNAAWPHGAVTASVGCASLHPDVSHGTHLVTQADEALYTAKQSGKDRIVHWNWQGPRELELAG